MKILIRLEPFKKYRRVVKKIASSQNNMTISSSTAPSVVVDKAHILEMNISDSMQRVARSIFQQHHHSVPFELAVLNPKAFDASSDDDNENGGTESLKETVYDECMKLGIVCAEGTTCLEAKCLEICPPNSVELHSPKERGERSCVPLLNKPTMALSNKNATTIVVASDQPAIDSNTKNSWSPIRSPAAAATTLNRHHLFKRLHQIQNSLSSLILP